MLQTDSIAATPQTPVAAPAAHTEERPQRPGAELRPPSSGAAPARHDSAMQAAEVRVEIHYSSRPDTLHVPGMPIGRNVLEAELPEYDREGFFSGDTLLHSELRGGRYGVAGDPVPEAMRADNVVTMVLLACFILGLTAISRSRRFIARQAKGFFRAPRDEASVVTETSGEIHFQVFLVFQGCMLLALLQYAYTMQYIGSTFVLGSPYQLMAIYLAVFVAYFAVKALAYTVVNTVFFGRRRNLVWLKSMLFVTAAECVLVYPVALLCVYFELTVKSAAYYLVFVLFIVKILTFYKCYVIFFKRANGFLQIILYFCTLEMAPLATLWGSLVATGNLLKINI